MRAMVFVASAGDDACCKDDEAICARKKKPLKAPLDLSNHSTIFTEPANHRRRKSTLETASFGLVNRICEKKKITRERLSSYHMIEYVFQAKADKRNLA